MQLNLEPITTGIIIFGTGCLFLYLMKGLMY